MRIKIFQKLNYFLNKGSQNKICKIKKTIDYIKK